MMKGIVMWKFCLTTAPTAAQRWIRRKNKCLNLKTQILGIKQYEPTMDIQKESNYNRVSKSKVPKSKYQGCKMDKIILDLCGGSGSWSRPYKEAGFDVRLITLPDYDVLDYIPHNVYGVLAAPQCTEFSVLNCKAEPRDRKQEQGMIVVKACIRIIEQ